MAISKRALVCESVEQADETHDNIAKNDAEWVQPFLQSQAPLQVSQRSGHRLTALVGAWLSEGLQQATTVAAHPTLVSWYQLYIDYQIRTGIMGLILMVGGKILQSE